MSTSLFASLMAAWWIVAETALVLTLEWASRYVLARRATRRVSGASGVILFASCAGLLAVTVRQVLYAGHGPNEADLLVASMTIWNGLCTLWVVLETAILAYLARSVRTLEGEESRRSAWLLPAVAIACATGFAAYHAELRAMRAGDSLMATQQRVENLLLFYIRICGVFWVALEGACAYWVWRGRKLFLARLAP